MPFDDTELPVLAKARDRACNLREEWRLYLNDCYEQLTSLSAEHDSRIDLLSSDGDDLYGRMGDAFSRSKECYSDGDHPGAGEWSAQGRALQTQLSEVNSEKNALISVMKAAHEKFSSAQENHRLAKAQYDTAQASFSSRLEYVGRLERERAEARAQRRAAEAQFQRLGDTKEFKEAVIRKANSELHFRDEDIKIDVNLGYDRDFKTYVTDFLIYHLDESITKHVHAVFDLEGNELLCEYHDDKRS